MALNVINVCDDLHGKLHDCYSAAGHTSGLLLAMSHIHTCNNESRVFMLKLMSKRLSRGLTAII